MSESDDDKPVGQRQPAAVAAAPPASKPAAKIEPQEDNPFEQPAPRARKPAVVESSDSDDVPIGQKLAAAKPTAESKPKPQPKAEPEARSVQAKPQSEAERALTKNESVVKREVEHQQKVEEQAHAKKAAKQQATAKRKAAANSKGGKAAKDGKAGEGKVKKERKEYDMPGQTKDTPEETDSLRKFYTSLRQQRPESQMARKWLAQYGLLPREEAEAFVKEMAAARAAGHSAKSPTKPSKPRARAAANGSAAKRKPQQKKPQQKKPAKDEAVGQKRKAAAAAAASPMAPTKSTAKKRKTGGRRDRAFSDGGLVTADSDSDDDVPLAARAATKA